MNIYKYTNIQYNRCIIAHTSANDTKIIERPYLDDYLLNNLALLLLSIESCANKLYVNWIDIVPLSMDTYKDTIIYQKTLTKINEPCFSMYHGYIDTRPGISLLDIYNTIANLLYHNVKNMKWLLYDIYIKNNSMCVIEYLEQCIDFTCAWNDKSWAELSPLEQNTFSDQWRTFFREN
jgi:hypothetical protein